MQLYTLDIRFQKAFADVTWWGDGLFGSHQGWGVRKDIKSVLGGN